MVSFDNPSLLLIFLFLKTNRIFLTHLLELKAVRTVLHEVLTSVHKHDFTGKEDFSLSYLVITYILIFAIFFCFAKRTVEFTNFIINQKNNRSHIRGESIRQSWYLLCKMLTIYCTHRKRT